MPVLETLQESSVGQTAQLLGTGKAALYKLKSLGKQSLPTARAYTASTAKDTLAHISVNLPEAPALRHVAQVQSASSQHCRESHADHPSADVLGFSHLPVSSADHVGSSVMAQTPLRQRRRSSCHSKVTVSLPDSPKSRSAQQHNPRWATESNAAPQAVQNAGVLGSMKATAEAGMSRAQGPLEDASGMTGLFGDTLLDAGPPCLSSPAFDNLSSLTSRHSSMADIGKSDATADLSGMVSKRTTPGSSSVELPLGQSDFSR